MKSMKKWVSALLCLMMLGSALAVAEETAAPAAVSEIALDEVVATVAQTPITWGDLVENYNILVSQQGANYDLTVQDNVDLFRCVALENKIVEMVMQAKAKELGFDPLTEEESKQAEDAARADWDKAIMQYIAGTHPEAMPQPAPAEGQEPQEGALSEEERKEAYTKAEAEATQMLISQGVTLDKAIEQYQFSVVLNKLYNDATKDVVVTDEEVEQEYQRLVAADKEMYENDLQAYASYSDYVQQMAMMAMMYGSQSDMDEPWYKPAGFRRVKHILLPVEEELMNKYMELQARFEEQKNETQVEIEQTAGETVEEAVQEAPVTEQQVNEAKAAVMASLADKIEEINQKIADGADFDALIAEYGVNADGTPSDGGMASEPGKTYGYEVCEFSTKYVPEFTEAAMSIENVGEVSAPYLSQFGVHIVKYIGDVEAGPVIMTDEQRVQKQAAMTDEKKSELYAQKVEEWVKAAGVSYTGLIPSFEEMEAKQAQQTTDAVSQQEAEALKEEAKEEAAPAEEAEQAAPAEAAE